MQKTLSPPLPRSRLYMVALAATCLLHLAGMGSPAAAWDDGSREFWIPPHAPGPYLYQSQTRLYQDHWLRGQYGSFGGYLIPWPAYYSAPWFLGMTPLGLGPVIPTVSPLGGYPWGCGWRGAWGLAFVGVYNPYCPFYSVSATPWPYGYRPWGRWPGRWYGGPGYLAGGWPYEGAAPGWARQPWLGAWGGGVGHYFFGQTVVGPGQPVKPVRGVSIPRGPEPGPIVMDTSRGRPQSGLNQQLYLNNLPAGVRNRGFKVSSPGNWPTGEQKGLASSGPRRRLDTTRQASPRPALEADFPHRPSANPGAQRLQQPNGTPPIQSAAPSKRRPPQAGNPANVGPAIQGEGFRGPVSPGGGSLGGGGGLPGGPGGFPGGGGLRGR